jgi:ATP-dependent Clp protease ATP-binding subunit ClpA
LNRLDDIAFFQTLNANQLSSIVTLQLTSLEERLKEHDIEITLTDKAIQSTLKKSYNPSNYLSTLFFLISEKRNI